MKVYYRVAFTSRPDTQKIRYFRYFKVTDPVEEHLPTLFQSVIDGFDSGLTYQDHHQLYNPPQSLEQNFTVYEVDGNIHPRGQRIDPEPLMETLLRPDVIQPHDVNYQRMRGALTSILALAQRQPEKVPNAILEYIAAYVDDIPSPTTNNHTR